MKNTKEFSEKIKQLKKLQVKDKEKFAKLRDELMDEFGVSQATIYRHLSKRVPGVRKTRKDSGKEKKPVPAKAKKMVTELLYAGKKKKDALKVTEEKLGVHISGNKAVEIGKGEDETRVSNFGSPLRDMMRQLCELDLMAPEAGLYFKLKGVAFLVTKQYLEDVILVIASAYNDAMKGEDVLAVDREQLAKNRLFYLFEDGIRVASLDFDMKKLSVLTKMYKDLQEKSKQDMSTDFAVFEKSMKELRPSITMSEIIALIKKHSKQT